MGDGRLRPLPDCAATPLSPPLAEGGKGGRKAKGGKGGRTHDCGRSALSTRHAALGKPAAARPPIAVVFSFGAAGTRGLDAPVDPVDTNGRGTTAAATADAAAARGGRETSRWHRPALDIPTASAPAAGTGTRRVRPRRADVWPCAVGAAGREMGTTRQGAGARKAAARAAAAGGKAAEECVGAAAGTRPPAAEREERISAPPTPPKRRPQPPPPDARKRGRDHLEVTLL